MVSSWAEERELSSAGKLFETFVWVTTVAQEAGNKRAIIN